MEQMCQLSAHSERAEVHFFGARPPSTWLC